MLALRSAASAAAARAGAHSAATPLVAAASPARTYVACASASAARTSSSILGSASSVGGWASPLAAGPARAPRVGALGGSQPARGMGIMDKLNGMIEGRKKDQMAKKRAEVFQWQLEQLGTMDTFNLAAHKKMLEDSADKMGLNDWRAMLRTKAQQAEIEEAWLDLKISQQLAPEELADPGAIHRREKLRIASAAGTEVTKVTAFLANYEQVRTMHRWMRGRKERGLPIPSTLEEFQAAMATDRAGLSQEMTNPSRSRPRSTRSMLLKQFKQ